MNATFIDCSAETLVDQIGIKNIYAISGGRLLVRPTGITLPVSNGYSVTIDLAANDTYTIRRIFTRSGKQTIKGEYADVFCDAVGELAYQASCFRNIAMTA